jgi:ankyrin repeat protein
MRRLASLGLVMAMGMALAACGSREAEVGSGPNIEESALSVAIGSGDLEAVKRELSGNPALLNQPEGPFGLTPLHKAAAADEVEIARFLIENGALVNVPSNLGQTPYSVAMDANASDEMMELLKSYGADD